MTDRLISSQSPGLSSGPSLELSAESSLNPSSGGRVLDAAIVALRRGEPVLLDGRERQIGRAHV